MSYHKFTGNGFRIPSYRTSQINRTGGQSQIFSDLTIYFYFSGGKAHIPSHLSVNFQISGDSDQVTFYHSVNNDIFSHNINIFFHGSGYIQSINSLPNSMTNYLIFWHKIILIHTAVKITCLPHKRQGQEKH